MSSRFSRISATVLLLILTTLTQASDDDKPFSVSGFGTLGVVHSDNRQVDIVRDLTQGEGVGYTRQTDFGVDSNIGLQINKRFSDNIDTAMQIVSRRASSDFQPEITWAFARYLPSDNLQLRVGRLGFDVYPLADSRNVGYSYLWVRPPTDFFGSLIVSYFDGADVVLSRPAGDAALRGKFFYGVAREKTSTGNPGEFLSLDRSRLYGGHIEYQNRNWLYRIGYSELRFNNEYPPLQILIDSLQSPSLQVFLPNAASLGQELAVKNKKFNYFSAGVVYDQGPLQAQLMFNQLSCESLLFSTNRAAYLTLGYRLDHWTPYFSLSASRPAGRKLPNGLPASTNPNSNALIDAVNQTISNQFNRQTTYTLGLRYDLSDKSNLKLQFDQIKTDEYLLIRNNQPGWNGKANLISLAFNFIF